MRKVLTTVAISTTLLLGMVACANVEEKDTKQEQVKPETKQVLTEKDKYKELMNMMEHIKLPSGIIGEDKYSLFESYIRHKADHTMDAVFVYVGENAVKHDDHYDGDLIQVEISNKPHEILKYGDFKELELKDGLKVFTDGLYFYWEDKENDVYTLLSPNEEYEKVNKMVKDSSLELQNLPDNVKNVFADRWNKANYPTEVGNKEEFSLSFHIRNFDEKLLDRVEFEYENIRVSQSTSDSLPDTTKLKKVDVEGNTAYFDHLFEGQLVNLLYEKDGTLYLLETILGNNEELILNTEKQEEELIKVLKSMF